MSKYSRLYVLSLVILLSGLVVFSIYVYRSYHSLSENLIQVLMPGESVINLKSAGKYTVHHEYISNLGKDVIDSSRLDLLSFFITIKHASTNDLITLEKLETVKSYSYRGRKGRYLYEFNIEIEGEYVLSGYSPNDIRSERFVLTVEKGFSQKRSKTIVAAQALLLFPTITALVLFLYAYAKNRF